MSLYSTIDELSTDNQHPNYPSITTSSSAPSGNPSFRDDPTSPMPLSAKPKSPIALAAVSELSGQIIELRGKQKRPSLQYVAAIGATVADLLTAASYDPVRACWRPLRAGSFSHGPVGYEPVKRALKDLEREDFVKVDRGVQGWGNREGYTTRIRVAPKLTDYFKGYGIRPANRQSHFTYKKAAEDVAPIQLRARSIRNDGYMNRGKLMKVEWTDPAVIEHAAPIRRLNAFLARFELTGPPGYRTR